MILLDAQVDYKMRFPYISGTTDDFATKNNPKWSLSCLDLETSSNAVQIDYWNAAAGET
jgi:hypothetical protein